MTAKLQEFSRVVISLRMGMPNRPALRFVTEFTKLLDLQLHGLMLEDQQLMRAAAFPFAREFRRLQGGWDMLGRPDLASELERQLIALRDEITSIARTMGLSPSFEHNRASTLDDIFATLRETDIIVVAQSENIADRAVHPFADLAARALKSKACVLLVPSRIIRMKGAILVLARGPEDPNIPRAAAIAACENAPLSVIEERLPFRAPSQIASGIAEARLCERLIVMDRTMADIAPPWDMAVHRHIPVLVTANTPEKR